MSEPQDSAPQARQAEPPPASADRSGLVGRVSPRMLLLLVVGDILGAGIYVLLGGLAAEVGPMTWAAFAGAFVLAAAAATSYAELVTRFPGAAGSPLYAREAFNSPTVTALVGLAVFASTVATSATTARAFAGDYLAAFVDVPTAPVAAAVVAALAAIAALGIETSARANATLTLVEASGLLLVVVVGAAAIVDGTGDPGAIVDTQALSGGSMLAAMALAFFAFLGFEDAVHLSEEVDDPQRTFPRVLLGAVTVTAVVYLLVSVTAGIVVDPMTLAASDGPLLEVVRAAPVPLPERLFSAIALGAVTNTSLFALVAASRLLYGMASTGDLPAPLARVSRRGSPVAAVGVAAGSAIALTATGSVDALARTAVTALLMVLVVVHASAIRTRPVARGWRPPSIVAWLGAGATAGLLVHELATAGSDDLIRLTALLAMGILARGLRRT